MQIASFLGSILSGHCFLRPEIMLKIKTSNAITSNTLINAPPISNTRPNTQNRIKSPMIVHNIITHSFDVPYE